MNRYSHPSLCRNLMVGGMALLSAIGMWLGGATSTTSTAAPHNPAAHDGGTRD